MNGNNKTLPAHLTGRLTASKERMDVNMSREVKSILYKALHNFMMLLILCMFSLLFQALKLEGYATI